MAGRIGSQVKLFFDDTGKVMCKEGVLLSEDAIFVQIKTIRGVEAIPLIKVVRMEVLS